MAESITYIFENEDVTNVRAVWKPGWSTVRWELLRADGEWRESITLPSGERLDWSQLPVAQGTSEWLQGNAPDLMSVNDFVADQFDALKEAQDG